MTEQEIIQNLKNSYPDFEESLNKPLKVFKQEFFLEKQPPEVIDKYIEMVESGECLDDFFGIDKSWERWKRRKGYYKRHPERKRQSQVFVKRILEAKKHIDMKNFI